LLICTNHKILGNKDFVPDKNASPWGIVSVKPQDVDFELPMEVRKAIEVIAFSITDCVMMSANNDDAQCSPGHK